MKTQIHSGLAPVADRYDGFVVDLWGTLHDGVGPLPGARECLARLHETGKGVVLLSNVPQRTSTAEERLTRMGIARGLYDHLWTSGEEVWQLLAERADPWYRALGRRCFYLGPERHRGMTENPGFDRVDRLAEADFILCTGFLDEHDMTISSHVSVLREAASGRLPLICANPDFEVIRGGVRELCAGALARHYEEELGGAVRWHGKPYRSVYDRSLRLLDLDRPARALMIGDSLRTDMAGAGEVGMSSAFVVGGIYAEGLGVEAGEMPPTADLEALFAKDGLRPDLVLPMLVW
ncbi:MAG: TIGR01459 family HAD-type hydrolase [Alphaproteobacteria bacterium]